MTAFRRPQILLCTLMTSAAALALSATAGAAFDERTGRVELAQAAQDTPDDPNATDADRAKWRELRKKRQQDGQSGMGGNGGGMGGTGGMGGQRPDGQRPPPQARPDPVTNPIPKTVTPATPPKTVTPVAKPVTAPPPVKTVTPPPAKTVQPPPPPKKVVTPPPAVTKPATPPVQKVVTPPPAKIVTPPKNPAPAPQVQTPPAHQPPQGAAPHGQVRIPGIVNPQAVAPQPSHPPPAAAAAQQPPPPAGARPHVRNIQELQAQRLRKVEDGGKRVVITEPDKRTIIKQNNQVIIKHDENARLQRLAPNARVERDRLGQQTTIIDRPNGQVITETDRKGNLIRRYRRGADGREDVLIDNRKRDKFGRNLAIGAGIGIGVIAGAAIINEMVKVPPPRVNIPRNKYVVRGEDASEDDVYEAFNAPPVDRVERRYSLDQVRATRYLRDRMRRVDLDDINFETGSWDIDESEYRKLERVARAMRRVIDRNPNEVFLIEGYTDAVGRADDNLTLSDRRAESVAEVLTREFDVPPENITTQGYGEQYLKIYTLRAERANRRVALRRITPLIAQDAPSDPRRWRGDRSERDDGNRREDQDEYRREPPPDQYDDRGGDRQPYPPDERYRDRQ